MPTYEYRCPAGHEFERFYRKISDAAPGVTCPVCGKVAERILSAGAGLVFKGSGFYLTDYGKNAHRAPVAKGDSAGAEGAGSTESAPASSEVSSESTKSEPTAKETTRASETGTKEKASGGESKPAPAAKTESKPSSESRAAKSGGPKKSKDK